MWDKSAATPGVLTMSKSDSSVIRTFVLSKRDKGCPIPPSSVLSYLQHREQQLLSFNELY